MNLNEWCIFKLDGISWNTEDLQVNVHPDDSILIEWNRAAGWEKRETKDYLKNTVYCLFNRLLLELLECKMLLNA